MTYDENSNPMNAQQEEAWLDDLKAFLDEEPSQSPKSFPDQEPGNPPKPASDFPNPFQTEMSDVFREFGTDAPERETLASAAVCGTMESLAPQEKQQKRQKQTQQEAKEDKPSHAVLFLTILVLLEAAAIIAVVASWLLWMK